MPYLGRTSSGYLTKQTFTDAVKAIYTSSLQCSGIDDADWVSDGPTHIPTWTAGSGAPNPPNGRPQQMSGWAQAVFNHTENTDTLLFGTRTSGILRSVDGGIEWTCVTDDLPFPVLGVRQFLDDPDNPDRIIAITGNSWVSGSVITSNDAGITWDQGQQNLPEFYWLAYHPTYSDLIFACSNSIIYCSFNDGDTWSEIINSIPPDFSENTVHKSFFKIIALEDRLIGVTDHNYAPFNDVFECTYTIDTTQQTVTATWVQPQITSFLASDSTEISFVNFSNLALGRYYFIVQPVGQSGMILESLDQGSTYQLKSGSVIGGNSAKCELIASSVDTNFFYYGTVGYMKRIDDLSGLSYSISGDPLMHGHHDDYRSSFAFSNSGQDRLILGNDGGIGLIEDGLNATAKIRSLNGDLSVNLLHAFNAHPETGRVVFAFQDHAMVYRDPSGEYSLPFLHEGSFAMIQQHFPDAIVGQAGYNPGYITDKSDFPNGIVDGILTPADLGAYQEHYRHYPERFAAGLIAGKIAMNFKKDSSEVINIVPFQNQGNGSDEDYNVGDVAICQRKPQFIYAATTTSDSQGDKNCLVKSINDADQTDPNPWINLSETTVNGLYWNETPETKSLKALCTYRNIRALAVDHQDENLVYAGIGTVYNEWNGSNGNEIEDEKYRVIRTTSGGEPDTENTNDAAWIDWSEGLPALPVERLLTVESDNHLIFCATSVGIYYRTDGMQSWECFSEGLPMVQITGLQYDYCNNILYASTYGRGLWKTEVNIPIPNSFAINIDADETWDENKTIFTNVTITDGAELTVTSIIRMASGTNFIVEPGGQLTLDGGTLTNACGEMWQGIQIQGNTDLPQTTANQGVLITKNNAIIENAREAISFIEPGNWDSRGGIAWCKDTKFINNKRSAQFLKYPSTEDLETYDAIPDYKSYFINCDFIFNDDNLLNANEPAPFAQVTLWGVKGVKFLGCSFENTNNVSQFEDRSKAISSIDASYRIDTYCDVPIVVGGTCPTANLTPSSFTGYNYAVHPQGATGNYGPNIRRTEFDQNMVGVYLDLANFSDVVDNKFTVGNHPYPPLDPSEDKAIYNTGILTTGLSNFSIEENQFFGDNTSTDFTHGVVVQEGEGALVSIYKNKMNTLGSGAIGAGDNDDIEGEYGLRFMCNENVGNKTDMEVRGTDGIASFGLIDEVQSGLANTGQASGNTFSAADGLNSNFVHLDYTSDKTYFYQYDDQYADQIPNPDEVHIESTSGTEDLNLVVAIYENTCPSNYSSGPVKGDYYSLKSEFYNLLYTYHQFIDQGNTEGTLNDIVLSWSSNAWTLRDELVARSPNNSDTVLISVIDQNILPHGMLLEVLVLNPDALQNGKVINHLKCCMVDPMPQYMIDIILASRNVQTARTLVEHNLSNIRHSMAVKHRLIVDEMLRDSTGTPADTLVEWLGDMKHLEGRYNLVSHYLGRGDYTMARATMDSLQAQLQLGGIKTKELNKMRQFTTFLENIDGQGKNIAQLDSTQIDYLIAMANDPESGTAGARAENILCFFYEICSPPAPSPKSNVVSPRKPKPNLEELIQAQNTVAISPNPADQYVQLEYELLFSKENTVMNIYDQLGRKVSTYTIGTNTQGVEILDTRKLVAGLYIVEIVQEGKQVFSDKFIVQH